MSGKFTDMLILERHRLRDCPLQFRFLENAGRVRYADAVVPPGTEPRELLLPSNAEPGRILVELGGIGDADPLPVSVRPALHNRVQLHRAGLDSGSWVRAWYLEEVVQPRPLTAGSGPGPNLRSSPRSSLRSSLGPSVRKEE